jgi:hypothetical protein
MPPRWSRTEGRHLRRSAATAAQNEQEQTMTDTQINQIERANREAWIAQREARWEISLQKQEIVRPEIREDHLPF